jgi:hypothetical protein
MLDAKPVHKFEAAGLGKAPFVFIGIETDDDRQERAREFDRVPLMSDDSGNYCTSCDYCSQAIHDAYRIRSSDGRTFKVGCECVRKTGDAGLIRVVKAEANKQKRDRRAGRERQLIAAGFALLRQATPALAAMPHPSIKGRTMLEYVEWMRTNAGQSGLLRVATIIRKAAGG